MIRIKNAWASILAGVVVCAECGKASPRTGPTQRYCPDCAEVRDKARKLKYAKRNPQAPGVAKKFRAATRSRKVQAGIDRSEGRRRALSEVLADETGMAWVRRIKTPFSYATSKNHIAALRGDGRLYLKTESKKARKTIAEEVWHATRDVKIVQAKLFIELIVQKPNHRGDAVNVLDLVCDAIKDATGLDDRWYALRGVDWQIIKERPDILIGVGQEATEDMRVCSYCGGILPVTMFRRNRTMSGGHTRECRDCNRDGARDRGAG